MFNFFYNIDKYIFDEDDTFYKDPKTQNFLNKSLYFLYVLICIYIIFLSICYYFIYNF